MLDYIVDIIQIKDLKFKIPVNCQLVADPTRVALWVFGEERLPDVYPLFTHHRRREHGHLVLDFLCRKDAVAFPRVVDSMARVWYMSKCPMMVLGLEAQVSLTHDDDFRERERRDLTDAVDMSLDERKLLRRLCDLHVNVSDK